MKRGVICWVLGSLLLLGSHQAGYGQGFFSPEVVVSATELSEQTQKELSLLQDQLEYMLINYAPDVDIVLVPKHPIHISVALFVDQVLGEQYSGSLEVAIYRPRYGYTHESMLVLFHEKEISFDFSASQVPSLVGRELPETSMGRVVYYYATLGAMYYYDSFSLNGGTPFLNYLKSRSNYFSEGWRAEGSLSSRYRNSPFSPDIHLSELQTERGDFFRELWYIYHREGLDSPLPSVFTRVLNMVFVGLQQLRGQNSATSFLPLFANSKAVEMTQHFQSNKGSAEVTNVSRMAEELFPSIVFGK